MSRRLAALPYPGGLVDQPAFVVEAFAVMAEVEADLGG
jgi:hypothetical protein